MYLSELPGAFSTGTLLLHAVAGLLALGPDGSMLTAYPWLLGLCLRV